MTKQLESNIATLLDALQIWKMAGIDRNAIVYLQNQRSGVSVVVRIEERIIGSSEYRHVTRMTTFALFSRMQRPAVLAFAEAAIAGLAVVDDK